MFRRKEHEDIVAEVVRERERFCNTRIVVEVVATRLNLLTASVLPDNANPVVLTIPTEEPREAVNAGPKNQDDEDVNPVVPTNPTEEPREAVNPGPKNQDDEDVNPDARHRGLGAFATKIGLEQKK